MDKLDRTRPFANIHGDVHGRIYEQDGKHFNAEGELWTPDQSPVGVENEEAATRARIEADVKKKHDADAKKHEAKMREEIEAKLRTELEAEIRAELEAKHGHAGAGKPEKKKK